MNISALVTQIDVEINRLQQARTALLALDGTSAKRGPGRPRATAQNSAAKKRTMSPEARARIGAAQKERWAASKKSK
jgi:hypothetical protein